MPVKSIKEELDHNIIRISAESHSAPKTTKEGAVVRGLALPFEKTSLNAFTYDTESIQKSYSSLEGKPVLWNHNPEKVIGHVKGVEIKEDGLHYEMDLDSEEKDIIRKMKRGDISSVSIQCVYDEEESYVSEDDVTHAYINEFLELSVVSIPGFSDTTAQFSESFKTEKNNKKIKGENMSKDKESKKEKAEGEQESKDVESKEEALEWVKSNAPESVYEKITAKEEEEEDDDDEEEEPEESKESKIEELEKRVARLEKAMSDDDEDKEEEKVDEEEDVEAEAKKREEAIKKNKKSVATEGTTGESEEDVEITDTQLKKAISETI